MEGEVARGSDLARRMLWWIVAGEGAAGGVSGAGYLLEQLRQGTHDLFPIDEPIDVENSIPPTVFLYADVPRLMHEDVDLAHCIMCCIEETGDVLEEVIHCIWKTDVLDCPVPNGALFPHVVLRFDSLPFPPSQPRPARSCEDYVCEYSSFVGEILVVHPPNSLLFERLWCKLGNEIRKGMYNAELDVQLIEIAAYDPTTMRFSLDRRSFLKTRRIYLLLTDEDYVNQLAIGQFVEGCGTSRVVPDIVLPPFTDSASRMKEGSRMVLGIPIVRVNRIEVTSMQLSLLAPPDNSLYKWRKRMTVITEQSFSSVRDYKGCHLNDINITYAIISSFAKGVAPTVNYDKLKFALILSLLAATGTKKPHGEAGATPKLESSCERSQWAGTRSFRVQSLSQCSFREDMTNLTADEDSINLLSDSAIHLCVVADDPFCVRLVDWSAALHQRYSRTSTMSQNTEPVRMDTLNVSSSIGVKNIHSLNFTRWVCSPALSSQKEFRHLESMLFTAAREFDAVMIHQFASGVTEDQDESIEWILNGHQVKRHLIDDMPIMFASEQEVDEYLRTAYEVKVEFGCEARTLIKAWFTIGRVRKQYRTSLLRTAIRWSLAHARLHLRSEARISDASIGIIMAEEQQASLWGGPSSILNYTGARDHQAFQFHHDIEFSERMPSSRFRQVYDRILNITKYVGVSVK